MSSGPERKNWWENLDWNIGGTVQETFESSQRILRNLPTTLSAHRLDQRTPLDRLQPDPVEKIKSAGLAPVRRIDPRLMQAPPKPACLEKKRNLEKSQNLKKEDVPDKRLALKAESKAAPILKAESKAAPMVDPEDIFEAAIEAKSEAESFVEIEGMLEGEARPETKPEDDVDATSRFTLEELLTPDYCDYK